MSIDQDYTCATPAKNATATTRPGRLTSSNIMPIRRASPPANLRERWPPAGCVLRAFFCDAASSRLPRRRVQRLPLVAGRCRGLRDNWFAKINEVAGPATTPGALPLHRRIQGRESRASQGPLLLGAGPSSNSTKPYRGGRSCPLHRCAPFHRRGPEYGSLQERWKEEVPQLRIRGRCRLKIEGADHAAPRKVSRQRTVTAGPHGAAASSRCAIARAARPSCWPATLRWGSGTPPCASMTT